MSKTPRPNFTGHLHSDFPVEKIRCPAIKARSLGAPEYRHQSCDQLRQRLAQSYFRIFQRGWHTHVDGLRSLNLTAFDPNRYHPRRIRGQALASHTSPECMDRHHWHPVWTHKTSNNHSSSSSSSSNSVPMAHRVSKVPSRLPQQMIHPPCGMNWMTSSHVSTASSSPANSQPHREPLSYASQMKGHQPPPLQQLLHHPRNWGRHSRRRQVKWPGWKTAASLQRRYRNYFKRNNIPCFVQLSLSPSLFSVLGYLVHSRQPRPML
jgi:hypothetical protein